MSLNPALLRPPTAVLEGKVSEPVWETRGLPGSGRKATGHDRALSVIGLRMSYGQREVLSGIDLEVSRGEVFAFLGPNGAGKTTTLEILEGFRTRTGGVVTVLGIDPEHATPAWREKVGVVLQSSSPEPDLTVRETLELYAGFYSRPRPVEEVLSLTGLESQATIRVKPRYPPDTLAPAAT